jgi:exopolysaccharide biosynthesis protein
MIFNYKNTQPQVITMDTTNTQNSEQPKKKTWLSKLLKVLGRTALVLLETVVLLVVILYGVMYILAKGPSPTARDIFVMSVRETSAMGFLADLFFTPEEIAAIEAGEEVEDYIETDTSLIVIPSEPDDQQTETGPVPDQWGLVDEDGDGIIVDQVRGEGYVGYMMVVLDPSRVIMGCVPESFGVRSYTVEQMAQKYPNMTQPNRRG